MSNKRSTYTIEPKIKVNITSQDIDDIMACALECGISYWCCAAKAKGKYLGEYASDQISRGGTLILHDAESSKKWELTLDKFLNGVKLAIEDGAGVYIRVRDGSIDTTEVDGDLADCIMQYALFGEVVFG